MSAQPIAIAPGQRAANRVTEPLAARPVGPFEPQAPTSEWFERAGRYAAEAVANAERAHRHTIETRLDKPSRRWTTGEVARRYGANADGERRFREEAEIFALHGYRAWLETEHKGHPRGGRLLLAGSLGAFAGRSSRPGHANRTVTWMRDPGGAEVASVNLQSARGSSRLS